MVYVLTGALAFVLMFALDLASLRSIRFVKPFSVALAAAVALYSLVSLITVSETVVLPVALRVIGWAGTAVFAALLVYSLFVEIPFTRTYLHPGKSDELVTTGTYALVRHPGVLWLACFMACLFAATGRILLLVAFPVWIGLDLIHVYLQDRVYFIKMFGEQYHEYKKIVPMLLPTHRSFRRFRRSFLKRRG